MKFFIDFEATQFSQKIIAIGCVSENGDTFQTLVYPNEKLTPFIVKLTGITDEMLINAPNIDRAFVELFNFITFHSDKTPPKYYCYGDTDTSFIKHSMKDMEDVFAQTLAQAMIANMVDYAKEVKTFFLSPNRVSLKKLYNFIKEEDENEQAHDALEDATMLAEVVKKLKRECKPEDITALNSMPAPPKPEVFGTSKKAPLKFVEWPKNKWDADTGADKTNWVYCCRFNGNSNYTKYFDSLDTATLWALRYVTQGRSVKKQADVELVRNKILNSVTSHKFYCNARWEFNTGDEANVEV